MKEAIIARRYAEAFFEYAKTAIGEKQALLELGSFKNILQDNKEFKQFLEAKEIDSSDKQKFIDNVFKDAFSQDTRNFFKLVIKKGRIHNVIDIIDYAIAAYSEEAAVYTLLKTSFPLDNKLAESIKEKLENKLRKRLNLNLEIDKTLIGGIKVLMGNELIDGSISARLNGLRQRLLTAQEG